MWGAVAAPLRAAQVRFSTPYLDETVALLVEDRRRAEFSSWDAITRRRGLGVGVRGGPRYLDKGRAELPLAEVVSFDTPEQMFQKRNPPLDAIVLTAER